MGLLIPFSGLIAPFLSFRSFARSFNDNDRIVSYLRQLITIECRNMLRHLPLHHIVDRAIHHEKLPQCAPKLDILSP